MDNIKNKLTALWNGQVPLWQTFWLYYFIGLAVINLLAGNISGGVGTILTLVALIWAGFMVLPIWKSADAYSGNTLFALAAKIAAIVIAIGVLTRLF